MKIKNIFLFVALFSALASNVKADSTNNAVRSPVTGENTSTNVSVDTISNSVPLTANITFFLTKDGWSMPNQFKADETVRATLAATIPARYLNVHTNAGTLIADATNNVWYRGFPRQMS